MKERAPATTYSDKVRELARYIINDSKKILTINYTSLSEKLLPKLQEFQNENKDNSNFFSNSELSPEKELGLNLFLSVVNFCYQDPSTRVSYTYNAKSGESIPRSLGLKAAMAESDTNWGDLSEVANLSPQKWSDMIQLSQNKEFYLGAERGNRIAGFARTLNDRGFKTASDFLASCEYKSNEILEELKKSRYFEDEFQKRSQLAVHVMDGVLKRRFSTQIAGSDTLTVMADYRLPQLLYNFGTLELSDELLGKLIRMDVIETGSPEELALRATTITVGEELSRLMMMPEADVDSLLWTLAVNMGLNGKLAIPHMLVVTDKY